MRVPPAGIWVLRLLIGALFIFFGVMKFPDADGSMWVRVFEQIGFGQWFRYLTGVIEVAGGLLLFIPRATAVAVALLVPTILGALLTHIMVIGPQPASVILMILLFGILVIGRTYWRADALSVSPAGRPSIDS